MKQTSDKPFAIVGVNSDADSDLIREIAKTKNLTWQSFGDGHEGLIAQDWCITAWPKTYLLDADGVIRYKQIYGEELDRAIEKLLEEVGHTVQLVEHSQSQ